MSEFKLPKKVKNTWLKALRSGKYKQCTGQLAQRSLRGRGGVGGYSHCCLGVARACGLGKAEPNYIPNYLKEDFMPQIHQAELAKMNDDGCSFLQIADYIEENF